METPGLQLTPLGLAHVLLHQPSTPRGSTRDTWLRCMHRTMLEGHVQLAKLMIKANVDVNASNDAGYTPLIWASVGGQTQIVDLLLAAGAKVDHKNKSGYTALHWACYRGHLDVVSQLVSAGADPSAMTNRGKTPLDLAERKEHWDVVEWLEEEMDEFRQVQRENAECVAAAEPDAALQAAQNTVPTETLIARAEELLRQLGWAVKTNSSNNDSWMDQYPDNLTPKSSTCMELPASPAISFSRSLEARFSVSTRVSTSTASRSD